MARVPRSSKDLQRMMKGFLTDVVQGMMDACEARCGKRGGGQVVNTHDGNIPGDMQPARMAGNAWRR